MSWTARAAGSGGNYRTYFPSALIDGKIYVYAGYNTLGMQAYDIASNTWTNGLPTGPTQGYYNGGAGLGGKFYVIGSDELKLWIYTPGGNWEYKTIPSSVGTRRNPIVVGLNGKLYVFGGGVATLWCYDPVDDTWTQKASGPTNRVEAATFTHLDSFYIVGGTLGNVSTTNSTAEVWRYNENTDQWSRVTDLPKALCQNRGNVLDGIFYTYGDYFDNKYFAQYNIETDTWTEITDTALKPFGTRGGCAHTYGDSIYWFNGYVTDKKVWRLTP